MSNFYIINLENQKETHFESNEIIIGRQLLENCNDKRISRTHAIIRLDTSEKFFWLIPTHTNPVFHRSFQDVDLLNVISKDDEKIVLRCEDKFGLLSDKHWFKIKQTIDFNTSNNNNLVNEPEVVADNIRVRNVEEVNETWDNEPEVEINCIRVRNVEEVNQTLDNEPEVETNCIRVGNVEEVNQTLDNEPEVETNCIRVRNVEEVNQSCITPVKRKLPDWMKSSSPNANKKKKDDSGTSSQAVNSSNQSTRMTSPIQSNDNELSNEETETVVDPQNSPIPNNTEPENITVKTEIKEEPTGNDCGTSTSTNTDTPKKIIIKKDPDPVPVNLRPSCSFGIRCYRRNPAHRLAEAHPGDSDYRRPSFPEPAAGTPPCPFGSQCYRRNPAHFQQFTHPPSTNAKLNRRNLRKAKNTTNLNQNVLFSDDDDSDDDFNGDSDSDEYVPGKLDESSESSISSINSEINSEP